MDAVVERLIGLGATEQSRTRSDDPADPYYWVVLNDPEGNTFCVG